MPDPIKPSVSLREAIAQSVEDATRLPLTEGETPTPKTPVKEAAKTEPTPAVEPTAAEDEGFSKFEAQLLRDVDTAGWTDAQKREWVKVRKSLVKGWHGSNAEHAQAKRFLDDLKTVGITNEDLQRLVESKRNGGRSQPEQPSVPTSVAKTLRGIDRLIEEEKDPQVKEQLRQSKAVILEEAEAVVDARVSARLKPLEDRLNRLDALSRGYSVSEANAEIDALEDEEGYPVELLEKYRGELVRWKQEYPQMPMEDILFKVVSARELKALWSTTPPKHAEGEPPPASRPVPRGKMPTVSTPPAVEEEAKPFTDRKGKLDILGFSRSVLEKVAGG